MGRRSDGRSHLSERLLRLCALWGLWVGLVACSSSSLSTGGQSRDAGHDTSAGACWGNSDCPILEACVAPGQILCPWAVCLTVAHPCTSDSDCASDAGVPQICELDPCVCGSGQPECPTSCAADAARMGCTAGCARDADCDPGQACGTDHRCAALACGAPGQTCPADFVCGSGGTCAHRSCTSDSECSKECVEGYCYASTGRCQSQGP